MTFSIFFVLYRICEEKIYQGLLRSHFSDQLTVLFNSGYHISSGASSYAYSHPPDRKQTAAHTYTHVPTERRRVERWQRVRSISCDAAGGRVKVGGGGQSIDPAARRRRSDSRRSGVAGEAARRSRGGWARRARRMIGDRQEDGTVQGRIEDLTRHARALAQKKVFRARSFSLFVQITKFSIISKIPIQGDSLFVIRTLNIDRSRQNNVCLRYTLSLPQASF